MRNCPSNTILYKEYNKQKAEQQYSIQLSTIVRQDQHFWLSKIGSNIGLEKNGPAEYVADFYIW